MTQGERLSWLRRPGWQRTGLSMPGRHREPAGAAWGASLAGKCRAAQAGIQRFANCGGPVPEAVLAAALPACWRDVARRLGWQLILSGRDDPLHDQRTGPAFERPYD